MLWDFGEGRSPVPPGDDTAAYVKCIFIAKILTEIKVLLVNEIRNKLNKNTLKQIIQ